jgi:protein-S-isoprenylcysteine O-methyltransferase Ste14
VAQHTNSIRPAVADRQAPAGMPALIIGIYAVVVYLLFLGVSVYAAGFFADFGVPRAVDQGPHASVVAAVSIDLALLALFAVQHTVMARPWFKRRWTRIVPEPAERATFVLAANDLFGLRQAWLHARRVRYSPPPFTERGLYRRIRHPLMAGFVVVFWSVPVMTAGHLLFAAAATGYILAGIAFEEHDLKQSLGEPYAAYRARVPALIPVPSLRRGSGELDR